MGLMNSWNWSGNLSRTPTEGAVDKSSSMQKPGGEKKNQEKKKVLEGRHR